MKIIVYTFNRVLLHQNCFILMVQRKQYYPKIEEKTNRRKKVTNEHDWTDTKCFNLFLCFSACDFITYYFYFYYCYYYYYY